MNNRNNLINQALLLFALRGYDAIGIQEIVDTAGVSKPTLYHYFKSKQGLLQALLAEHFMELNKLLKKAADYKGDLSLSLQQIVRTYFNYATKNQKFYRFTLYLWFSPPGSDSYKAINPYNLEQHKTLETLFASAVADHGNMRGRQSTYASTFLGVINTYIGIYLNDMGELNEQLIVTAVHQFMHGILS